MAGYLLDVNVLFALLGRLDPRHDVARHWFEQQGSHRWYTCPITENGTLRILTNHPASGNTITFDQAAELLEGLLIRGQHSFLSESVSLLNQNLVNRKSISPISNRLTSICWRWRSIMVSCSPRSIATWLSRRCGMAVRTCWSCCKVQSWSRVTGPRSGYPARPQLR